MAGFWRNIVKRVSEFITGTPRELPKPRPIVKPNAGPRSLPKNVTGVSRETPAEEYVDKLTELADRQDRIRAIEATMFDESLPVDTRKAALAEYVEETGWYRPESNSAWSSEEWRRWEQIYESEPEVF